VLDHRVREDDVELAVGEGQRAAISLGVADMRVTGPEPGTILEPERGDALGPRVHLLEEVERAAAVALAEPELVRSDVEDARHRGGLELVEKELQLALAGAQRDGVGEAHARKYPFRPGE
jgi:hypothetical protein